MVMVVVVIVVVVRIVAMVEVVVVAVVAYRLLLGLKLRHHLCVSRLPLPCLPRLLLLELLLQLARHPCVVLLSPP